MPKIEIDLGQLLDALPAHAWTVLPDGRAEYVGKKWLDYIGLTPEQASGAGWLDAVHPDDIKPLRASWAAIIASGKVGELRGRLRGRDGVYRWFQLRASPMPDSSGDIVRWCGISFEIEDLVHAEAELRDHRGRLERIFQGLPVIAGMFSPAGKIISCNHRMLDFLGMTLEEIQAKPQAFDHHPDDHEATMEAWWAAVRDGQQYDHVARLRRKDGAFLWHRLLVIPLRNDAGDIEVLYGIASDIDAQRRAEELLSAEKRLLERVAKGVALPAFLDELARAVEALSPCCYCAILLVDESGKRFRIGAAPTLPDAYKVLLDGKDIDPDYGPLSRSLSEKARIIVADVTTDPRWAHSAWPAGMTAHGLHSNWSAPILAADGAPLAAFAIYRAEPQAPTPQELEVIDRFSHIAGLAIERERADAALKEGEAELRRANEFLTEAQRLSKTGSFTWDYHPEKQIWSDEMYRIVGIEPGTMLSVEQAREMVVPEDRHLFDVIAQQSEADLDMDTCYRISTPHGVKHVHVVAHRMHDITDRRVYLGALQDVTESKIAEAALKASEEQLRRAYDSLAEAQRLSHTGSFITDLLAEEHDWSDESYRIFDFDRGAPLSVEAIRASVHPEDVAGFDDMIARAGGGEDVDFTFRIVTAKGVLKHVRGVARVVERVEGRPLFVGALQDVTDSKLVEEALRASQAELLEAHAHLTEAQRLSRTGSFTWDFERDEHNWSEEERRIWEFAPDAKITMAMILEAIHPDDLALAQEVIGGAVHEASFEVVLRIITKSGALKHLHIVGRRVENITDRPVFLGAVQDITERKLAEEALNRARAELAHMSRAMTLSALTASIAHEVNQPLAGIITNANTGLRMLALDPPNVDGVRATIQRTLRDGNRASEVIQRLRAMFARKAPNLEPVDLNDAVREVLSMSAGELQQRRVVVTTDFADDLPAVSGDRIQLQQVILNLVLNAADAMRDVNDRPRAMCISTHRDGVSEVGLSVRDAGTGLEPDKLEQLFLAFYTTKPDGMGIGLAISRTIIQNHDGRLWAAANEDGPGATFSFSIPNELVLADRPEAGATAERATAD
jgi:PAS domain S-box-containing protein